MFCPYCGRYSAYGQVCHLCSTGGSRSLIKRNDNAARASLRIDGLREPFHVSQSQLARVWPGGLKMAQQLGNRVIHARDILGRDFESREERDAWNIALKWVKSRLTPWPMQTHDGYEAQYSIFDDLIHKLRNAFRSRDFREIDRSLEELVELFRSLELLFGVHGVGPSVRQEVLAMGLEAAPLVSEEPSAMYNIMMCMWSMMKGNEMIIYHMFNAISPNDQDSLAEYAKEDILSGRDHVVATKIIAERIGLCEEDARNLVLTGVL